MYKSFTGIARIMEGVVAVLRPVMTNASMLSQCSCCEKQESIVNDVKSNNIIGRQVLVTEEG